MSASKKRLVAAAVAVLATCSSWASTSWTLDSIAGAWTWGNTEWNAAGSLGSVNDATDVGTVDAILHGPYVYQAPGGAANGIYNYPYGASSLTFSLPGLSLLNTLSILSSRSYSTATGVGLDYSADNGATWTNVLSSTTGALGWTDVGTGGTTTEQINLSFGGVNANAFRLFFNGDQISLHTLSLAGNPVSPVPEPGSMLMLLGGLVALATWLRRRPQASPGVAAAA